MRIPGTLGALVCLAGLACAPSGPPENLEPTDLFRWAVDRFSEGRYGDAVDGFQAFIIRDPLNPLADSAGYMIGETRFMWGRELEAAADFSRFATNRPGSELADDAQLGVCRSYLAASPGVSLTQEFTRLAIEECDRLLQFFPGSPLTAQAAQYVLEARAKLAEKSFEIGKYYQDNRRIPGSAIVYYEKAIADGPSLELFPKLLFRMWQVYDQQGFSDEAAAARERLLTEFPDSGEAGRMRGGDNDPGAREEPPLPVERAPK
ncbi:MAG: outer membrane protein assembly factor BamD [Gemmatimonadetes bacterium]|nr:outer membrane protein assembly factor BamD [Gemmatimonadota bacterium]